MGSCDLCGKNSVLKPAIIEGIQYSVCSECAGFGTILRTHKKTPKRAFKENNLVVRNDFSKIIKQEREKVKKTQREFAQLIHVKESLLHSWELGTHKPTVDEAARIEKLLGVKLTTEYSEQPITTIKKSPDTPLTIGDLIKNKLK